MTDEKEELAAARDFEAAKNHLRSLIRDVPDFPSPGILFRDITPLLANPEGLLIALDLQLAALEEIPAIDLVVGVESRGFLFGTMLAQHLGCGFAPARKPGKLPAETVEVRYALEYGEDALQLHTDAVSDGDKVLIVDDLLATGGTAKAAVDLVRMLGGEVVGCSFLIELAFLKGRDKLDIPFLDAVLVYN
jgi:adenine phosphoribosyltransferase